MSSSAAVGQLISHIFGTTSYMLSKECNTVVDTPLLVNYILSGYNPEDKIVKSRLDVAGMLADVAEHELTKMIQDKEKDEIEKLAKLIVNKGIGVLIGSGCEIFKHDNPSPLIDGAGVCIEGTDYEDWVPIWLHKTVKISIILSFETQQQE